MPALHARKEKTYKYYNRVYVPKELKEQLTEMAFAMYNESKDGGAFANNADESTPF
ncbi:MAG: hypothetical protein V3V72_03865 [Ignavibacteriaceae bacterium]